MLKHTSSQFGIDGFLTMLVGSRMPYRGRHSAPGEEWQIRNRHRADLATLARTGLNVKETLTHIRKPTCDWYGL